MAEFTLLTGATGLVGQYLLRDLLLDEHEVAVLVRSSRRQSAEDRVEQIMQRWDEQFHHPLPRPHVIEGNVAEDGLGMSPEDANWVRDNCQQFFHNAAILQFEGLHRGGEPWQTNLHGTERVLDFCKDARIRQLHYTSTSYVAGLRSDRVMEDELDVGQRHRNDYEDSKFLAEQTVRAADFFDQKTIYRPAVIAGDSKTGFTSTYHGIYLYFRLLSMLLSEVTPDADGRRRVSCRVAMTGTERRNIVPVDWVGTVMAYLFTHPETHGQTYHLSPDQCITVGEITDAAGTYYNAEGAEFIGHETIPPEEMNEFELMVNGYSEVYHSYDQTDNVFDRTNLKRAAPHLPCPVIDEAMLHRFMAYGDYDRWGRGPVKKKQPAEVAARS